MRQFTVSVHLHYTFARVVGLTAFKKLQWARVVTRLLLPTLQGVSREVNAAILEAVNASGAAFLIHTELGGEFTMRMAIGATHTQQRHVDAAWTAVVAETERQLAAGAGGPAAVDEAAAVAV